MSDALADRVQEWLGIAMTKVTIIQVQDTDFFAARLPPFRKFCGMGKSESMALDQLRSSLEEFATGSLLKGESLPTWESKLVEVSKEIWPVLRVAALKRLLKTRAAQWGTERQLLPAGIIERIAVEVDAVITRHAMQMQGVSPPPKA